MKSRTKTAGNIGFGIDFGTTNSVVAAHRPNTGKTTVCTDKSTDLPHPSVVWYRLNESPRVGREAKRHISGYAEVAGNAFVQSVKRRLGKGETLDSFGEKRSAKSVATDIFRFLLADARSTYRFDVTEAVVTVPIYFDGRARRELREAADDAGVYIKTFVHEPFAALVGYLYGIDAGDNLRDREGQNILVFDWGGGTLDITVGQVTHGRVVELSTAGIPDRAGDHFDHLLSNVATRKFQERNAVTSDQVRLTPTTKDRFFTESERCKIELSEKTSQAIQLADYLRVDGKVFDLSEEISRDEFEEEILADIEQAQLQVDRALDAAGLRTRQVDLVLLIGGSSRVPLVQRTMRERFGHTVVNVANANSIIAEGAAIADALGLGPAFAASVAVELSDGTHHEVFKAGDLAKPEICNKTLNFFCTDNRDGVGRLIVGLADGLNGKFDRKAIVTLPVSPDLPRPYNHERVTATFHLDEDLVLHVDAKAATQAKGEHEEIIDLRFALSATGAHDEVKSVGPVEPNA